ncbi:AT-rich interactive domain-containing protein 2-like isoform X2 [Lineus longissimus]|uniref:AT-rich interactive domain-containing protein 2-like isoform X2 n=1 Tax=Lineus longissimus TaxID=88925 RepID=UPI00315DC8C2
MAKILGKDPFSYQKEYNSFLQDLKRFHQSRGTLFKQIPRLCGKEVDLYLLYTKVTALGGWEKVNDSLKWEEIVEHFHIPTGTTNGAQALKQIYMRHLDLYEKVNHFGEDTNRRDDDEDEGHAARKKAVRAFMNKVPMSYNYRQHNVPDQVRASTGLSMDFAPRSEYEKLEKSLLSGLPNEVDFAINVCTLLSNEGRHVLKLDQSHRLIELLMAQVGIYTDGPGSYIKFHEEWRKLTGRNFVRFWCDSVRDKQAQDLVSPSAAVHLQVASSKIPGDDLETTYELDAEVNEHIFNFGRELGIADVEGQRIMQLASIIRNLSFEEENLMPLASNLLIFRFLLLCTYSKYSCLKQIGLDTLGNVAIQMVLEPIDCWTTQLIMKTICRCLASQDKFDIVRGMEILSKLSQVDENEDVIADHLEEKAYEDIINTLSVLDIQLIVHALEVLYQLSELGEITTTHIAMVRSSVDMLVQLVTIEAQSYGQNALFGVKVVEHAPPPMQVQQHQQMVPSHRPISHQQPPQQLHHPPPQPQFTMQRHVSQHPPQPGPPQQQQQQPQPQTQPNLQQNQDAESEQFACNWLNAHFESKAGFRIQRVELYAAYLSSCSKNQITRVISTMDFTRCLKMVFPDVECVKIDKPNGTSDIQFLGIRRRPVPRPFPLPGEMMNQRGPIVNQPHLAPSPQTSCSPRPIAPPQGPIMPPLSPSPHSHMTPPMSPAQRYSSTMPPQSPSPHRPPSTSSCDSQSRPTSVLQQQLNTPPQAASINQRQQPPQGNFASIHLALNGLQRPMTPQSPSSVSSYPSSAPSPTAPNAKPTDTNMIKSLLATKVHNMQMQRIAQAAQSNPVSRNILPAIQPQPALVPVGQPPVSFAHQIQPHPRQILPRPLQGQPINQGQPHLTQGQSNVNRAPSEHPNQGPVSKPPQANLPQGQAYPPRPGMMTQTIQGQAPGMYGLPQVQFGVFQRNKPQHLETPTQAPASNEDQTCTTNENEDPKSQSGVENGPVKSEDRKVDKMDVDDVRISSNDSVQNNVDHIPTTVLLDNGLAEHERTLSESDVKLNCATDTQFTGNDLNDKDKDKKNKDGDKKKNPAKDTNESPHPVNSSGNPPKLVNGSVSQNEYRKLPPQSDISVQSTQGLKKSEETKDTLGQKPDKLVNGLVNHLGNGDILLEVEKQKPAVVATILAEDVLKPILKEGSKDLSLMIESNCKSKSVSNDVSLQNGYLSDIASPRPAEQEKVGDSGICVAKTNGNGNIGLEGSDTVDAALNSTSVEETNEIKNPQTIPCAQETNAQTQRTNQQSQSSNPHLETSNPHSSNPHFKVTNVYSEASNSSIETTNSSIGTTDSKPVESSLKLEQCGDETQNELDSVKVKEEEVMDIDANPPSNSSVASKPSSLDMVLKDIHDIIEDKSVEEMLGVESKSAGPLYYNEIKIGELASNIRTQVLPIIGQPQVKMDITSVPYPSVQFQGQYQQGPPVGNPHPQNIPTPKSQSSGVKRKDDEKIAKSRKKTRSRASSTESRRSSTQSVISSVGTDFMCEWANCRKCFENAKDVFPHVYKVHLNPNGAGVCQWDVCDRLVRQKFSLCTHVQDRHCTEAALKASLAKRQQAAQTGGQPQMCPTPPPPPIYPNDAAIQAIRRFSARPPYQELMEPKEGPVTKHIRLTSALILRNLARYSAAGRSLIKRHENQLAYVSLSCVESSTAIANCLWELHQHH